MRERNGSIGAIEEVWKRRREKRREGEEEEAFRSSKKTIRSSHIEKRLGGIRGDDKEIT